jgi:hypothetical protein
MSFVTTLPEMLTCLPSTSSALLLAGGSPGSSRDGAGVDGDRRAERRRNGGAGDSPMDILTQLPAVVVLERIPVPTHAVTREGVILFANTAFAEMVGYRQDKVSGVGVP